VLARVSAFDDADAVLGAARDFAFAVSPDDRALLRWASVEFAAWPFGGYVERARRAATAAASLGAALYSEAIAPFVASTPACVIVETSLADAMRLPWELLHDGERFIALGDPPGAIVRVAPGAINSARSAAAASAGESSPLRVLLVTARPKDAASVDARVVARTLYRRLEPRVHDGSIAVEFLRPPTFAALIDRLRAGPRLDVVHFDGHGTAHAPNGTTVTPSLVFENENFRADVIPADRFARALSDANVRSVVLTACETALIVNDRVESAAAAIARAGVAAVVAMGDEILVDSAASYSDAFYQALARGTTVVAAHATACAALAQRPAFQADWWTPQFSTSDRLALGPVKLSARVEVASTSEGDDFVGRSDEFIAIDRARRVTARRAARVQRRWKNNTRVRGGSVARTDGRVRRTSRDSLRGQPAGGACRATSVRGPRVADGRRPVPGHRGCARRASRCHRRRGARERAHTSCGGRGSHRDNARPPRRTCNVFRRMDDADPRSASNERRAASRAEHLRGERTGSGRARARFP